MVYVRVDTADSVWNAQVESIRLVVPGIISRYLRWSPSQELC